MTKGFELLGGETPPGTLLFEESYRGQNDHPQFIEYLRRDEGQCTWFVRPEITQSWTVTPIISEGFNVCYPLIAERQATGEVQGIHVSPDPWFLTDMVALRQRINEWETEQHKILVVRNSRSYLGNAGILELKRRFGNRLIDIDLKSASRFGVICDNTAEKLLVQLTDEKLLRIYQGF